MADESSSAPQTRRITSDADKAKARKWFAHARTVADTKNYDYAVELYVNGLGLWPDALDEGLKQLRLVATARKLNGGKPAGFLDAKKRSVPTKDPVKALNNAFYLFGKDPGNSSHMEQILIAASKAGCDRTVQWIAGVFVDAIISEKKSPEKRYEECCRAMESAARMADLAKEYTVAIDILQACLRTAQIWAGQYPDSAAAQSAYSSASSNHTIIKGKFSSGEDFRESLKDAQGQRDIHDKERVVRSVDRQAEMIAKARREWEANREVQGKLITLVDLLARNETDEGENEGIALLDAEYAAGGNYSLKSKADDLRMRQVRRHAALAITAAKSNPQDQDARREALIAYARQNKREIEIYTERAEKYPTDLGIRYNLAVRLFKAKQYDQAIPMFQQAQNDARNRLECRMYLGRCFLEKGFHDQAVQTLESTVEEMESKSNDMAKEASYWLGRSLEASGRADEAKKTYGHLIQLDYNYADARKRLEALSGK